MAKRTAKQKAASKRNIKKAQKARKKPLRKSKKVNKRRKSNPGVAKKKSGHRARAVSKAGKFLKGFLGGGGAGQLADDALGLATDNPLITVPSKVVAASVGGYYVGSKSIEGLIGGVAAVGLDLGLRALAGRTTTGVSRFRL